MKKNNKSKKIQIVKDKLLILLLGILIILTVAIITIWIANINNLKTDSDLVISLHNYFSSDNLENCEGLFNYDDAKVEYNNIDSETRLCLAYQKAEIKDVEIETAKVKKKKDTCTIDGMVFKKDEEANECTITKIKTEIIDGSYKKIFGEEIENNEFFKVDNQHICYLKDEYYYCGLSETFTYILGSESIIYRVIKKAEEKGSEIIINDFFVKINKNTCYSNYTTSTVNEKCTEKYIGKNEVNYNFMKKYGTEYKHVYKIAEDGTYYWVSSEPINN